MCDPVSAAMIGSAAIGAGGSLLGKKKGAAGPPAIATPGLNLTSLVAPGPTAQPSTAPGSTANAMPQASGQGGGLQELLMKLFSAIPQRGQGPSMGDANPNPEGGLYSQPY